MNQVYRFLFLLILSSWVCTQAKAQGLVAGFNTAPSTECGDAFGCSSFTVNISGVEFEFSFVSADPGRSMQWIPSRAGVSGGSMELISGDFSDYNTNERLTIRRKDRQQFDFASVFIQNNDGSAPVTVASYNQGVLVNSQPINQIPFSSSVNFSSALVDEVRISSNDFYETVFDNFIACVPPVPSFTVASPVCLGNPANFIYTSTPPISVSTFAWDFTTDGTVDNTTKGSVSFTYPATGTYNARLTITQGRCTAFADQQVVVGTGSAAPVVQGSLCPGATSLMGTSTEPNGTVITVAQGANQLGTGTVQGGQWMVTVPAVTAGQVLGVRAAAPAKCESTVVNITVGTNNTPPVIANCPSNITIEKTAGSTACTQAVSWTAPTATDDCGTPTLTASHQPGDAFPVGTTTVTYTATDGSGNQVQCSFTVTVTDRTPPVVSNCPANISVAAAAATCSQVVNWTEPTAASCNGPVTVQRSHAPGSSFALGTTPVTYTFTDAAGNSSTCAFDVVVTDGTAPVVSNCPSDIMVMAATGCSATASWTEPTATDGCSLPVTVARSHAPGSSFPAGATTVTYTFTDAAGNTSTCSFVVTVMDNAAPVISNCPANITVQTGAGNTACSQTATWTEPTAIDGCGGAVTVARSHAPGSSFPVGNTTVTYTFTDASGNSSTCSFVVTVQDNTPPVFTCPTNITIPQNGTGTIVNYPALAATDNCSGNTTVQYSIASGAAFPEGTTAVTVTVTDAAGNSSNCQFNVTVIGPCTILPPANIRVPATAGQCGAIVTYPAATTGANCGALTYSHPSGAFFPVGTTTVTVQNPTGGQTTQFTITVTDNVLPVIANCPSNITIDKTAGSTGCTQSVSWTAPTATDDCGTPTLTASHQPGDAFPVGTTTVTYTATDGSGNQVQCSFTVTVTDRTPPVVSNCPANISVAAAAATCSQVVNWTEPTAASCNGPVTVQRSHAPGSSFALGTTRVTYTFTDAAGNSSTCAFDVVVTDGTAPVVSNCPADIMVMAATGCSATATWTEPTATDGCSLPVSVSRSHAPGSSFPAGATTVTYTFTDAAGNTSTCSFVVTVMDNAAPVISNCPANITVQTGAGNTACAQTATWTEPTAIDGCGGAVTVNRSHAPGSSFPVGNTTVTYTFIDAGGNSSTCSFVVTVQDNTLPAVSCPADITVTENGTTQGFALVNFPSATATDNCSGVVAIRYSQLSGSRFPVGTTPVTVTATDAAGNSSTCSFNVTVQPSCQLVAPANIVVDAEAGRCGALVNYPAATTSGNCGTITYSQVSGSLFPLGTTTVTVNSLSTGQSTSFTITVVDKSAPVFANCPADITVQTGGASGACAQIAVWTAPTATDNCGLRSLTSSHQPGAVFPVGVTTVTYTATDEAGNQSQCRFTVTVVDNTAPVVSNCPANITVQATAVGGSCATAVQWTEPTVADNCGAPVAVTRSHAPGSVFQLGTTTVRYTFRDAAGNETLCTFTVTVADRQPPVISVASVSPNVLDQSDKEMVTVKLNYNITDNCTVNAAATRIEITSNEPVSTDDRGDKSPDWELVDNTTVRLRAEAWSKGKGRVYTITISTADGSGNQASKSVTVLAPERLRSGGYYRRNIPAENFQVRVLPNPSNTTFTIVTTSTVQEALTFRVYDATGRLMESRAGIPSSGTTFLGQMYPGGFYYLEVQQGSQKTTLKLIKQTQ